MGKVQVVHQGNVPAWGALYWQYFEDIDKIAKSDASLDVEKALFVEQTGASGKELVPINGNRPLQVGDKVVVRLTVRTDRDIEFVHLKDLRAACFEPIDQISGTCWQEEPFIIGLRKMLPHISISIAWLEALMFLNTAFMLTEQVVIPMEWQPSNACMLPNFLRIPQE